MRSQAILQPLQNTSTLKDRTLELVTDAILSGKIRPGERLNESQLARELHVSRAPVREALQRLQHQGLIANVARRGMFVVELDEDDIQKINSLRVVLEAEALRLARKLLTPARKQALETLLRRMERPMATKVSMRVDFEFHRMVWGFSGNEYLENILSTLTAALFAHSVRSMIREDKLRMILDSHRALFDYICGRETKKSAEELMAVHLSLRYPDPLKYSGLERFTK